MRGLIIGLLASDEFFFLFQLSITLIKLNDMVVIYNSSAIMPPPDRDRECGECNVKNKIKSIKTKGKYVNRFYNRQIIRCVFNWKSNRNEIESHIIHILQATALPMAQFKEKSKTNEKEKQISMRKKTITIENL